MSSAARPRIGRSYTRARRHPWVLGKLGDWRIPMGPYTPPQLAVASIGAFALIKTFTWWAPILGPLPVVAWGFAIWAARHSRISGRSPFLVVLDALSLAAAPGAGRIGGRAVRPMRPVWMSGSFFIEDAPGEPDRTAITAPSPTPVLKRTDAGSLAPRPRTVAAAPRQATSPAAAPVSLALTPLQQMLAAAAAAHPTKIGDQR